MILRARSAGSLIVTVTDEARTMLNEARVRLRKGDYQICAGIEFLGVSRFDEDSTILRHDLQRPPVGRRDYGQTCK